jgi:choline dehydrogenase
MSTDEDWWEFRAGIRYLREIFSQPVFVPFAGKEIQPGAAAETDEALDAVIREHAESAYHPCGTAKMGRTDDPTAVVDPECRVIGVDRLRLADSSIFPRITNGNLNAPTIMVGEKAADHILDRTPLASANDVPWEHPNWQTAQR